ncbi:MAG TPA: hypothetical protein VG323_23090 [Thermoanaerobaculia bacterium]|nr:hypothetical protein [Thermoanaerobaculia bacterium]
MDSVKSVVRRLLPKGTGARRSYAHAPAWPPDLFAVAATLVNLSGCYAQAEYQCGLDGCLFDEAYREYVSDVGLRFSNGEAPPPEVQQAWTRLLSSRGQILAEPGERLDWWNDALFLLAVADEACTGVGFAFLGFQRAALTVFAEYRRSQARALGVRTGPARLPYIPNSLCRAVPPHEVCVQPKTRTPQIGCTLRSLTHNLALLPPVSEVKTHWDFAAGHEDNSNEPLNVLLVPFPYNIRGTSFVARPTEETSDSPRAAFFDLRQTWLDNVKSSDIVTFIQDLIRDATREVERVHAVVLPEAALTAEMAASVAETLGKESDIELFVSGAIDAEEGETPRNVTYSAIFKQREVFGTWTQSKHHRWKLEETQVRRYHLGHVLGKKNAWWERINVADRECHFYVFRHGASLAVLVCEDLARIDPVQTVVRAVGPNLVIALLMDGAQIERRWPGRYATVLADDPGSAVLTLTSVGLIRRSNMPSERGACFIGLWKESLGSARELELPDGCHSLLLTISPSMEENVTADGRSDDKKTMKLSLTSIIGLRHGNPPPWLNLV